MIYLLYQVKYLQSSEKTKTNNQLVLRSKRQYNRVLCDLKDSVKRDEIQYDTVL
jgi:hypothetical protein